MLKKELKDLVKKVIPKEKRDAFLALIKSLSPGTRIALVGHDSPDPDVSGNFKAWKFYFKSLGFEVDTLAFTKGESTLQNQAIEKFLGITFEGQKFFDERAEQYELKMFCDTTNTHSSLEIQPDVIWDHHKEGGIFLEDCLVINEEMGASCTMTYLFLADMNVEPPQDVILGLAMGIDRDTRSTQDEGATDADIMVLQHLISELEPKNFKIFNKYCHYPPRSIESIRRTGRAFGNVLSENGVVFAFLGETRSEEDNSYGIIADELTCAENAGLVVVVGIREGKFEKVSIRVDTTKTFGYEKVLKDVFKIDFYSRESGTTSGGRSMSAGGGIIALTSYEKGQCKDEEKKEIFLADKHAQRWSDLQKFVAEKSAT